MPRSEPVLPECLTVSKGLRMPVFEEPMSPAVKIRELESYLLLTAFTQGELEEERLGWLVKLVPLKDRWDHLQDWEHLKQGRTNEAIAQAKCAVDPQLYDQMSEVKWVIARLTNEIDRLERDATKVSRAYSMITGS